MKKFYTLLLVLFTLSATAQKNKRLLTDAPRSLVTSTSFIPTGGQGNNNGYIKDRCGFVAQMNKAIAKGYDRAAFEAAIQQKIAEIKASRGFVVTNYIIPVVFHIIHDGTAEGTGANVNAAQIYEQIDQLNKDFGNLSGSPFAVAANTGLRFCPVLVNPAGTTLAQAGIDRINRVTRGWTDPTSFGSSPAQQNALFNYIDGTIKPASIWDPTKYVNIWMYNFSNSGLLGYATFPSAGLPDLTPGETATDAGVVFLTGAIGSIASPGTATPYALGRTVSHELGHFFGLYHTWGDEINCSGTDYCADTPPCSDEYYSPVPSCTIPVQCSSMPRMIQNYMDYSDDGCMNTFTLNQTDRLQAVMAASPRRPSNPGATICTPLVGNAVTFLSAGSNTPETGNVSACPRYKDYLVSVAPALNATGNATVNFSFSGTATQNVDYSIIGPVSVSYTNGESGAKGITIRVIDDAEFEPSETIIVNFTVTGTGLVMGTTNQTYTLTITNDDLQNFINNTNLVTTLFTENFGTTAASGAIPTGWLKGSFIAGNNVWTVNNQYGTSTGFTTGTNGRVLHITNGNAALQTAETANAAYTITSESHAVVVTSPINTTGYQNIKVTFDYACNGEADASGIYDLGFLLYTTTTQSTGFRYIPNAAGTDIVYFQGVTGKTSATITLPSSAANVPNLWLAFEWYNDNTIGNNPPFIVDNIVVTGENSGVETVLNQTVTQTHNMGQTQQYMSNTNKIIAAVTGPNMNIGCNTATITAAGNGNTALATGGYFRSNKVIQITPSTANSTAAYQVTLYYTTAELAVWGPSISNLKILKVNDGVSLSSILLNTNATVYNTTVDDQRTLKGYAAFTANVTGGFSQFMLASPTIVIPISLLSFDARGEGKSILLNWSTATEINNKGFVIERSTDGIRFTSIGWMDGKINSSQRTDYQYADNFVQAGIIYHYRLRQTDLDSREKLSMVRQAKIKSAAVEVSISPNPANERMNLFVFGATGQANINLLNMQGQLVHSWKNMNTGGSPLSLDINNIPAGMYLVQVLMQQTSVVSKMIIK